MAHNVLRCDKDVVNTTWTYIVVSEPKGQAPGAQYSLVDTSFTTRRYVSRASHDSPNGLQKLVTDADVNFRQGTVQGTVQPAK